MKADRRAPPNINDGGDDVFGPLASQEPGTMEVLFDVVEAR